jgi:hypothetical protein
MMIVAFVVKGIVWCLLALGIAITVATAVLVLSAFIPATVFSAIASKFSQPRKKLSHW